MKGRINLNMTGETNSIATLSKNKSMYLLKRILIAAGIIGALVTFIVDMAVNHKLTWSLIVDAGLLYIYAAALAAMFSKSKKIYMAALASSILLLPLLYIIQVLVNKNYLPEATDWFKIYALPIALIWMAIIWLSVLARKLFRLNLWFTLGVLLLLTIIGSVFTNSIARHVPFYDLNWIDSLSYLMCAVICFVLGYLRKDKCKI